MVVTGFLINAADMDNLRRQENKVGVRQRVTPRLWLALVLLGVFGAAVGAQAQQTETTDQSSAAFSKAELRYLTQKKTLRYCIDPDGLPFEAIDAQGRHIGISADYLQLFQKMLPVPLKLVPTQNRTESISYAKSKGCDFMPLLIKSPELSTDLNFTSAYLNIPTVLVTTLDKAYLNDVATLPQLPLGVRHGDGVAELYQHLNPALQLLQYQSDEQALRAVRQGILYGYIANMASVSYPMQQNNMLDLKIAGRLPGDISLSFASRSDEPQLGRILQKMLMRLSVPQQQQIHQRWLQVHYEQGVDPQLVWQGILIVTAFGLLWLWAWVKLRRLNSALLFASNELTRLSQQDPLTGLYNRQFFEQKLPEALSLCQRQQLVLTLAMMDLDHFKKLNDEYGQGYGDACLREFSRLCRSFFQRPQDVLVRYGGEAFVLISVGTAPAVMEKLLRAFVGVIASSEINDGEHCDNCTVSIGAYCDVPTQELDVKTLLDKVTQALAQAKQQGRDQLVLLPAQSAQKNDDHTVKKNGDHSLL